MGSRERERRHSERISVLETKAFCQSPEGADWYEVGNISEGGLFLKNGHQLPLQTKVTIDCMRFEGRRGRMIGEVVRNTNGIGIRFDLVNENSMAFLEEVKSKEILSRSGPVALALVKDKRAIEWFDSINADSQVFVVRAERLEDAKSKLNDPWIPLSSVILDNCDEGRDLARFINQERPELTMFLVTTSQVDEADKELVDTSDLWIELQSPEFKSSIVKKMSLGMGLSMVGKSRMPTRRRREFKNSKLRKSFS